MEASRPAPHAHTRDQRTDALDTNRAGDSTPADGHSRAISFVFAPPPPMLSEALPPFVRDVTLGAAGLTRTVMCRHEEVDARSHHRRGGMAMRASVLAFMNVSELCREADVSSRSPHGLAADCTLRSGFRVGLADRVFFAWKVVPPV